LANDANSQDFIGPIRRLLVGVLVIVLLGIFLIWRIDSPRVERFRVAVIDRVVPSFDWAMAPVTGAVNLVTDFRSYQQLAQQNDELRRELQKMKAWQEAASQLEEINARLLDLNSVSLDAKLTYITGVVITDSGSPFRQSVLLNLGARDGIVDGWATMDGIGLVGRVSGVGQNTSRVILLTDTSSRIPVTIKDIGQKGVVAGDNTLNPPIEFLEDSRVVRPGDRVVTSGDGGVFPPDLLVGYVALGNDGRLRVRLSADYGRLQFLRVLRAQPHEDITDPGSLLTPIPAEVATVEQPSGGEDG